MVTPTHLGSTVQYVTNKQVCCMCWLVGDDEKASQCQASTPEVSPYFCMQQSRIVAHYELSCVSLVLGVSSTDTWTGIELDIKKKSCGGRWFCLSVSVCISQEPLELKNETHTQCKYCSFPTWPHGAGVTCHWQSPQTPMLKCCTLQPKYTCLPPATQMRWALSLVSHV